MKEIQHVLGEEPSRFPHLSELYQHLVARVCSVEGEHPQPAQV
jgi:hypothetical protein